MRTSCCWKRDVPHAWIGAEYMLAFRTMLAFEREADRRPDGVVSCTLDGDLTGPSVTIILQPPLPGPLTRVEVNGSPLTTFAADSVPLAECPADVMMWC